MTLKQIISAADALKPNSYPYEEKRRWALCAERRIYNEIYLTHGHKGISFTDFGKLSDTNDELFAPAPYDELYVLYIGAMVDFNNAEYGRYNNTISLFNELYDSFARYWHNNNMPLPDTAIAY